jgi:hypothetical protein
VLKVIPTGRFRKDYALMKRRGKDMEKLVAIVDRIAGCEPLSNDIGIMLFLASGKAAMIATLNRTGC